MVLRRTPMTIEADDTTAAKELCMRAPVRVWSHPVFTGAQGRFSAQQAETSASQLSAQGCEAVGQLERTLEDYVRAKPLRSLLIAAGVGMMVALLWRK
jgi:hypothetical protein